MRTLNTSLPRTSTRRRGAQASGELLQAFKSAALSVTQLYKTAASDQEKARLAGYQDALDDLLSYLDQENIGVGDGEGWSVRKWATERLDSGAVGSDGEADVEEEKHGESMPLDERRSRSAHSAEIPVARPEASSPIPPEPLIPQQSCEPLQPRPDLFHFRSISMPTSAELDAPTGGHTSAASPAQTLRHDSLPRYPRAVGNRTTSAQATRDRSHPSIGTSTQIHGSGSKRKAPLSEFFDISNLSGSNHFNGGGAKRGRFT